MFKCSCQHCGGWIEFDDTRYGERLPCPHCNQEIDLIAAAETPPILPPVLKAKNPKSLAEIIAIICIIAFVGWTLLCGLGAADGIFEVAKSEQTNPAITSDNQYEKLGGTLGFVMGMGIWFCIWLAGAIPTFMVFIFSMFFRKRN
jgi:hypothetical protein